jgi:hypothetical protein
MRSTHLLSPFLIAMILAALLVAGCQLGYSRPRGEPAQVKGIVYSLNYTPHGDVDGCTLVTGEVIHLGPKEARQLNISKGDSIVVDGEIHRSPSGVQILEAREVNGLRVSR